MAEANQFKKIMDSSLSKEEQASRAPPSPTGSYRYFLYGHFLIFAIALVLLLIGQRLPQVIEDALRAPLAAFGITDVTAFGGFFSGVLVTTDGNDYRGFLLLLVGCSFCLQSVVSALQARRLTVWLYAPVAAGIMAYGYIRFHATPPTDDGGYGLVESYAIVTCLMAALFATLRLGLRFFDRAVNNGWGWLGINLTILATAVFVSLFTVVATPQLYGALLWPSLAWAMIIFILPVRRQEEAPEADATGVN